MTKKQVAEKQENELSVEMVADLLADSGIGTDAFDREDIAIPRISILQQLSPQVTKGKAEYIADAEVGEIYNTVTMERIDGEEGIYLLPISYRRAYIEWKPRAQGGGLVADHGTDSSVLENTTKDDQFRDVTDSGNHIVTTAEYFVYIVDKETGAYTPAVLSMSASQLKKARRWNTLMSQFKMTDPSSGRKFTPATFARLYHAVTVPEMNDKGAWVGWEVSGDCVITDVPDGAEIYAAARDFREKIVSGEVKAAPDEAPASSADGDDDDSPM